MTTRMPRKKAVPRRRGSSYTRALAPHHWMDPYLIAHPADLAQALVSRQGVHDVEWHPSYTEKMKQRKWYHPTCVPPRINYKSKKKKLFLSPAQPTVGSRPPARPRIGPRYQQSQLPVSESGASSYPYKYADPIWQPSRATPAVWNWLNSKPCEHDMLSLEALHQSNYDVKAAKEYLLKLETKDTPAAEVFYETFRCLQEGLKKSKSFDIVASCLDVPVSTVLMHYYNWKRVRKADYCAIFKNTSEDVKTKNAASSPSWLAAQKKPPDTIFIQHSKQAQATTSSSSFEDVSGMTDVPMNSESEGQSLPPNQPQSKAGRVLGHEDDKTDSPGESKSTLPKLPAPLPAVQLKARPGSQQHPLVIESDSENFHHLSLQQVSLPLFNPCPSFSTPPTFVKRLSKTHYKMDVSVVNGKLGIGLSGDREIGFTTLTFCSRQFVDPEGVCPRRGDCLMAIDEIPVAGMNFQDTVSLLKANEGRPNRILIWMRPQQSPTSG